MTLLKGIATESETALKLPIPVDVMSVTVTLETVTMETTEKYHVVMLHLLSISNLPTKLLKCQAKKKILLINSIPSSPSYPVG